MMENQHVRHEHASLPSSEYTRLYGPWADNGPEVIPNSSSGAWSILAMLNDEKRPKGIVDYLSHSHEDFVDDRDLNWYEEDPRVLDLCLGTNRNPALNMRFRRGLSQRSLAIEYSVWEVTHYGTSRIMDLVENPSSSRDH